MARSGRLLSFRIEMSELLNYIINHFIMPIAFMLGYLLTMMELPIFYLVVDGSRIERSYFADSYFGVDLSASASERLEGRRG